MAHALSQRRRAVLGAVVEHHIATGEPVGSSWVAERIGLGVCPATVRGDMSDLERVGYLEHPHTSAGRVPTDLGYRVYVEEVMARRPAADAALLDLTRAREVEQALEDTCRALARLTRYLSLAQAPSWDNERLQHLQLSRLDARRVLAVILTQSGRVHHALLDFERLPTSGQLRALASVINDRFGGCALGEVGGQPLAQAVRDLWPRPSFTERALRLLAATLPANAPGPLVMEGSSQLLAAQEFQQAGVAREVFAFIEERSRLRELLARPGAGLSVTIGAEAGHPAMRHCALMAASFEAPGGGTGRIGVLGPKRMRYDSVMSALARAARALGQLARR